MRVAINGFGRIGRNFLRTCYDFPQIEIVAVNDITDAATLCHLLTYDSTFGRYRGEAQVGDGCLVVNGKQVKVFAERDPKNLPWGDLGVDYVLESTGFFRKRDQAGLHLEAGAKRVVISAPAKDPDVTIVMGVNEKSFDPAKDRIISNASCTTNCLAPVAKVLLDSFGIEQGLMTTIHAYTNDQKILDLPHSDLRRARAAGLSMIPTSTGAAKAIALVIPELKGKLDGMAIRVPTPDVSVVDLTVTTSSDVTVEAVNGALRRAAEGPLKGILRYTEEELVSIDFLGDSHSSIVDGLCTNTIGDRMAKVLSWYDNEWGYSCRIRDLMLYMAGREN